MKNLNKELKVPNKAFKVLKQQLKWKSKNTKLSNLFFFIFTDTFTS